MARDDYDVPELTRGGVKSGNDPKGGRMRILAKVESYQHRDLPSGASNFFIVLGDVLVPNRLLR